MSLRFIWATALVMGLSRAAVLDLPIIVDNSYSVVEVDVGTPAKTYRFLFDTGSATSWAVDEACAKECTNFSGYDRVGYSVEGSSTGNLTGEYGSIEYFGGTTAGPIASDLMKAEGVSWNQSFIAADISSWGNIPADGFMGMAFNSIIVGGADTVMKTLMPQLDAPKFGIYYSAESDNSNGPSEGRLTLGRSREADFVNGKLETVTIEPRDRVYEVWASTINSVAGTVTVDGKKIETETSFSSGRVVFDTGAGRTSLSKSQVKGVYESIGMNWTAIIEDGYIPKCSDFNSSWSVSFSFSGQDYNNPPVVTLTGDQLANPGFANREDACWPPFDEGDSEGFTLIGKDILHNFYTVWDFGAKEEADYKPTLSFGKLKKGSK
ncbi:hypothetical protein NM208_g4118 [Fusarium decemcellulare]|uniref:Uncharacterized protein n=1 Tax=Fusarium decemcellulare TaxID=57161 RepID=A0ACC1SM05_9HYPO|nr:hypothetical protein NM208_g4118 [Fusarium decemcellulare]